MPVISVQELLSILKSINNGVNYYNAWNTLYMKISIHFNLDQSFNYKCLCDSIKVLYNIFDTFDSDSGGANGYSIAFKKNDESEDSVFLSFPSNKYPSKTNIDKIYSFL